MADKVLYFPYIRVPKNEWFSRVLLYWDEVGSIIPSEYQRDRVRLGQYMKELIEAGLIKEVVPAEYTAMVPEFRATFLGLIDNNPVINERRGVALERHETVQIHIEKVIGNGLTEDLRDRGLAEPGDYPWWEVEKLTADLFMGYLASVLGKLDALKMDPMTDSTQALSVFSKTPQHILNVASLVDQLQMSIVEDILPGPAGDVGISELIEFKEQHYQLLPRFRREIEKFIIDLSPIVDEDKRNKRIRLFKADANDQIQEIIARMHERRWPRIVLGGLCGIVAAAIPGAIAIATGTAPIAAAALPGLVSATYSAFSGIPDRQEQILREPLAYAAFARERFSTRG